jgi:hypothetical protein
MNHDRCYFGRHLFDSVRQRGIYVNRRKAEVRILYQYVLMCTAGIVCSMTLHAQSPPGDQPGLLSHYPFYRNHPIALGHCYLAGCDQGLIVSDGQTDSVFLLTTSKVFRSRRKDASVISIRAASDFIIELPRVYNGSHSSYILHVGDDHALRVFTWRYRYAHREIFEISYVTISNAGISPPIDIGEFDIDSIAVDADGEMELLDTLGKDEGIRLTISPDGSDIDRDEIDVDVSSRGKNEYPPPLLRFLVYSGLDPVESGYFTYTSYDIDKLEYGTNAKSDYTWLMDMDTVYGIRNTVLQHLSPYVNLEPLTFTAVYDSTGSAIQALFPSVDSSLAVEVRLIDHLGVAVAEHTDSASSMKRVSFSTKHLEKGMYSVVATVGNTRGARTIWVK